eukprot:10422943-Prorocentrum_lima.AAC.1
MIAVCKVFLGDAGRFTYMWSQAFYTFVTMWFYTVVVAVALADTFALPGFDVEGGHTYLRGFRFWGSLPEISLD